MARTIWVAGNWKMNGSRSHTEESIRSLRTRMDSAEQQVQLALFPSMAYLDQAVTLIDSAFMVGSQDVAAEKAGAFTGEVSAAMVSDLGAKATLIGHSERRELFGDTNDVVAKKYGQAQAAGLLPVLCVGETLEQRQAGETETVIWSQVETVVAAHGVQALGTAWLAYEPVWAIGTGVTASPEQAQSVHAFLRAKVAEYDATIADSLPILYGGSVKPENAAELFSQPDIDGGLIGGASLDASDLLAIYEAARSVR